MTSDYGSLADWAQVIATLILAVLAFFAGRFAWKDLLINRAQLNTLRDSSDRQLFSALLKEISGDEASYDRGLVSDLDLEMEVETIKKFVKKGRELSKELRVCKLKGWYPEKVEPDALKGIAIERTIVRYDRVGFFLMGEDNKPRTQPPTWLWTHVNIIWLRLYKWIEHRQTCVADTDYYYQDYAKYLHKLANTGEARARRVTNQDC